MRAFLPTGFSQEQNTKKVTDSVLVYVYFCFSVIITRVYLAPSSRVYSCFCHFLLPQAECIRDRYKTQKCGAVRSCLCHFLLPQPECVSRSWL